MIRQHRELSQVEREEAAQRAELTPAALAEALQRDDLAPEELLDLAGKVAANALRERGFDLPSVHRTLSAEWEDACSGDPRGCPIERSRLYARSILASLTRPRSSR